MPITDRTRKLLWGNSGNRCAICRRLLAAAATNADAAAVLGEECHIVAQSPAGPRAGEISSDALDLETNLILLCRDDHRRVDAQPNSYSSDKLRSIKVSHETWVHSTLEDSSSHSTPQVRIRRVGPRLTNVPFITSGADLLAMVLGAMAYDFNNDDLSSEEEVEIVGSFFQSLQDYGEAGDDLESGQRVQARFELGKMLSEVNNAGFFVYGGVENHVLEGGVGAPSQWPIARIRLRRASDIIAEALKLAEIDEAKSSIKDAGAGSAT